MNWYKIAQQLNLNDIMRKWNAQGITLYVYENNDKIILDSLIVPKEKRGQGVGTTIMNELTNYADSIGKRIELTPAQKDPYHGTTSRRRVVDFYKRFGLRENKGRNKDFTTRKEMYREPNTIAMKISNILKKADLWEEIQKYGPRNRFNYGEVGDLSLIKERLMKEHPSVPEEEIEQYIIDKVKKDPFLGSIYEYRRREGFAKNYGWSVPSKEGIDEIKEFVEGDSVLEVASGYGLWAKLLQEAGVNIVSTDLLDKNKYIPKDKKYTDVIQIDAVEAIKKYSGYNVLMMVWPEYDSPLAYDSLRNFQGNKLIFIGEDKGGCTGNDAFFELLGREWELYETVHIPRWEGIYDYLFLYIRT